ncbi:MAG: hypothetical protein V3S47_06670 [Acidobacteriota bacterium]
MNLWTEPAGRIKPEDTVLASYAQQREQAEAWLAENGYGRIGAE